MNICLFFGTFNPIHNAHLRMAKHVLNEFKFDKVFFVPSFKPPHKQITDSLHRLKMVKLAVESFENYVVLDVEHRLGKTSYTYFTILELKKVFPEVEKFNFLIGTDAFEKIESWYEIDELKKFLHFIVFKREKDCDISRFDYLREKGYEFSFTSLDFCDISSTEIRYNIDCGKGLNGLVPKDVEDYIYANGLYRRD